MYRVQLNFIIAVARHECQKGYMCRTDAQTILYINKYYEVNLTTGNATSYYYLGDRLVAMKKSGENVTYVHQDHLGGTSVVSDSSGGLDSSISYHPYGSTRTGSVSTDKKFTCQRLDDTGLYYYNARYYEPQIGRFISPDTVVQNFANPQSLNRYSYVLNNPLKYSDPSGHWIETALDITFIAWDIQELATNFS